MEFGIEIRSREMNNTEGEVQNIARIIRVSAERAAFLPCASQNGSKKRSTFWW